MSDGSSPGFFGKVPARGDFLSRRLPPALAASWEAWLQELTLAVREAGQRGWQDAWLTAPLWHFVLGRAVAAPYGGAGVLVASADRVGRLFPFTIIGAAAPAGAERAEWARTTERLALVALGDDFDPATLEAALAELGPPAPAYGPNRPEGVWPLQLEGDWPGAGDPLAAEDGAEPGAGPDQSEWWCRGSDLVPPVRLRCAGLPRRPIAAAMILGGEGMRPAVAG